MDAAKENMVKKYNLVKAIEEEVLAVEEALKIAKNKAKEALIEYKNAKFQVDIIKRKNHIEEIFWRFPHVGQQIFKHLDNQSLAKCQIVSPLWKKSIEDDKIIWIRIIQEFISMPEKSVAKSLQKSSLKNLKYSANYVFPVLKNQNLYWSTAG